MKKSVDSTEEGWKRRYIQHVSATTNRRRQSLSTAYLSLTVLALIIALVPLVLLLQTIISNGYHFLTWSFLTKVPAEPTITHLDAVGGIVNGLVGTIVVVGLALTLSVPIGIGISVALCELKGSVTETLRTSLAVLLGLPSVLFGIFVAAFLLRFHAPTSGVAGIVALSILMVPVIAISGEGALRSVPKTYVEAALALGAAPSKVMSRVTMPMALPRIITGIFLALARASGETAPILLVIGISSTPQWNPFKQTTALPTLVWQLLQGVFPSQRQECWGVAIILMAGVLTLNIIGRSFLAKSR